MFISFYLVNEKIYYNDLICSTKMKKKILIVEGNKQGVA
tara:strand:+ start:476 stop:592 length:117 start_codon:yes stop_codon:yes gene_type:complete